MTTFPRTQAAALAASHAHHGGDRSRLRFAGHFVEMYLAMGVGMALGGQLGIPGVTSVDLRAALWLVVMIVPMVAWMRFRGMSWRSSGEMSAAMAIPTLVLMPVCWAGIITAASFIGLEHGLMAPAMLALMVYRHRQYGW